MITRIKAAMIRAVPQPMACILSKGELVVYSVMSTGALAVGSVKKPPGQVSANSAVNSSGAVSPLTRASESRIPVARPLRALRATIP